VGRALEIADDEGDLERGDAFERRNHSRDSTPCARSEMSGCTQVLRGTVPHSMSRLVGGGVR
jgi:hypothetical protein